MTDTRYRLKELAELAGLETRTIRWYISEGLLRGPESMGRNAYYSEHHLKRLLTIKLLKEIHGLPLERIRKYLLMARDDVDIEVVPLDAVEQESSKVGKTRSKGPPSIRRRASWRRQQTSTLGGEDGTPEEPDPDVELPNTPLEQLLESLAKELGGRRVSQSARRETLTQIEITREIGLVVRGEHSLRELDLFQSLADHIREILIGGTETSGEGNDQEG